MGHGRRVNHEAVYPFVERSPPDPSGLSIVGFGPATKPSSDMVMSTVVWPAGFMERS